MIVVYACLAVITYLLSMIVLDIKDIKTAVENQRLLCRDPKNGTAKNFENVIIV